MTAWMFMALLICAGMWNITDAWFSLSLYLKDDKQTWYKDHYIRVIRLLVGVMLLYLAGVFGKYMIGG